MLISCVQSLGADQPTSRPARRWGRARAGLALSVECSAAVRQGGGFVLAPALRNVGRTAGGLCPRGEAVAWLILKHTPASGAIGKYYFSGRVFPGSVKGSKAWPAALDSGGRLDLAPMDFGLVPLHPYSKGVKFLSHHVTGKGSIPAAAGKLQDVLGCGKVSVQYMLYLPRKDDSPIVLKSDFLSVPVGPPDLNKLSPDARKAFVADLIAGFGGDPFAGRSAHQIAVSLDSDIVDDLITATKNPSVTGGGRMWLVTALADIRDKRCAAALVKLIDEGGSVGHVVAYHGPKQRDAELDKVIIARGASSKDARLTALAMLGFMVFRGQAPATLVDAGVSSDDPRVRTTVIAALSKTASIENVQGLVLLLKDSEPRVRSAAAKALGAMGNCHATVVGGLIAALEPRGDRARSDVCQALGKLTGRSEPYDSNASDDAKQKVIVSWRQWWAAVRKNHR
ncbi:MAG: HEAT repeat domain-containing protein [Phycisphaerae bacterium]|nr:HEAT repeat domain-containing protein [Phycisphaerae bacterium]